MTDWDGPDYARQSALQKHLADLHLAKVELRGDERVLDLGCGDGRITAELARRLPRGSILGVDASPEMVAFARAHAAPNLAFCQLDARALPFDQEFDLVLSFNALHWVREQGAVLRGVRAALKPEGRALLLFVPRGSRPSIEDVAEDLSSNRPWSTCFPHFRQPFHHVTPAEYAQLARANDLTVESEQLESLSWDFGDRAAFARWISATFGFWISQVPAAERDSFVADVLDAYRRLRGEADAEHVLHFYQLATTLVRAD